MIKKYNIYKYYPLVLLEMTLIWIMIYLTINNIKIDLGIAFWYMLLKIILSFWFYNDNKYNYYSSLSLIISLVFIILLLGNGILTLWLFFILGLVLIMNATVCIYILGSE